MLPNKVKTSICLRKDGGCEPTFTVETAISTNVDEVVQFLILHQSDYINAFFNVTIAFSSGMYCTYAEFWTSKMLTKHICCVIGVSP